MNTYPIGSDLSYEVFLKRLQDRDGRRQELVRENRDLVSVQAPVLRLWDEGKSDPLDGEADPVTPALTIVEQVRR